MNYAGPGTDLDYNLLNEIKPVDPIDRIALEHDYNYTIHPNEQEVADIIALKKAFDFKPTTFEETINKDIMLVGLGLKELLYNPVAELFNSHSHDNDKPNYLDKHFEETYGSTYDMQDWYKYEQGNQNFF